MRTTSYYTCIWHFALCIVVMGCLSACQKEKPIAPLSVDIRADLLAQVNALRAKGCRCGVDTVPPVPQVSWNDNLARAAAAHAMDMYAKNYFDHVSPQGVTPGDWATQNGYSAASLGEDIAKDYETISATVTAWKASPGHCTVLMDSAYRDIGGARYGNYWVVLLGRAK